MDFSEAWGEAFVEEDGPPVDDGLPLVVRDGVTLMGETLSSWEDESDAYFYENPHYRVVDGMEPSTSTTTGHPIDDSFAQVKGEEQPWSDFVPHARARVCRQLRWHELIPAVVTGTRRLRT